MLDLEAVVDLPGKLTYEQILDFFRHARAYIQSSGAEGLSNSLVEAMANGLPSLLPMSVGPLKWSKMGFRAFCSSRLHHKTGRRNLCKLGTQC